mgnify:CR=1 FL=1|jgi:hypothetical protein|tara:strand:+ start:346 stop:504 length:159 start_codon:yes stop_codon:yes gene_type:complete
MNNKKDSEIAWIDIGDKIKKEWKINVQKEEEKKDKKIISFKAAAKRIQSRRR